MFSVKRKQFLIFFVPSLIVLGVTVIYPLIYSLIMSFTNASLKRQGFGEFIGLDNYIKAFKDTYFIDSGWNTIVFTVIVVTLEFLFGLAVALLLNRIKRGKKIFFTIIIVPMLITPVAVGLIWRLLLHPDLGIVNYLLGLIGVEGQAWLGDAKLAMMTVVLVDIWHQLPFMILLLLAGLVSLPGEPYEAATIDGAGRFQTFLHVTLPLMKETIVVAVLFRVITAIKTYDLIYVLTKGGPGTTTEVISYHIYKQAYTFLNTGYSSAMSYLLLLVILLISTLFVRVSRGKPQPR
ncbi:carbohydrate ABC transporter permease [Cohnella cholangitidis]|uniref:Sugar ABC transporter permease n=1 Tax=Cohnella cholangitidis TaxID=2598458 RepID=A0A7G5BUD6_9BACL|nr:sugar ABC transporter permease [Cohnella cholangitidis]QMV40570.1 sugar ABC transporter permease [Cohnella cholangitidis]